MVELADKTDMTYWYPKLERAGLPQPETFFLKMGKEAQQGFFGLFDGDPITDAALQFIEDLKFTFDNRVGYPGFLRTGHTSAKHEWEDTCFVASEGADFLSHVTGIIEYSEMAGIIGMPWDWWVVRKFLTGVQAGVCPHYGNMPVCREWRFFVREGQVLCFHPYWPDMALERGGMSVEEIAEANKVLHDKSNIAKASNLAAGAGEACGGEWSVDIFDTESDGLFITDMAEASKSFHMEDCPWAEALAG